MSEAQRPVAEPGSRLAYWVLQIIGWGVFTLSRFVAGIMILHLPWARLGVELVLFSLAGLGLTHALRSYVRRHHWSALPFGTLSRHITVAAFVLGIPLGIMTQFTELTAFHDPAPWIQENAPNFSHVALPTTVFIEIVNWAFLFIIWLTIYFSVLGMRARRSAQLRQSEMARALHLAELRLLKSQLNPHFLFNALNTVRSLIADNPSRAQVAVTQLANTLRYTLRSRQDELVTLAEELAIVEGYLEIESMRFEERLRIETDVAESALKVRVPVMLLQTLVENAVKHGIAQLPEGGLLRILARVQDETLILQVENPRPSSAPAMSHEGVGLNNAHDRLRLLFGSRASLELDLANPALATARLRIPVTP